MDLRGVIRAGLAAVVLVFAGCATRVEVAQGRWLATCADVRVAECQEIAEVFVNNLARSEEALRKESHGVIFVSTIEACPAVPDWAQADACWRASAPTTTTRACMIIARQKAPAPVLTFGQVGGDDFAGAFGAPRPGTTPC